MRLRWRPRSTGRTSTSTPGCCGSAGPSPGRPTGLRTAAGVWQEHGLVFTTEIGTPLEPRNVLRRFELLEERAGLRGVTLHTLRHSAASFLLAAGTHTKVVQEHLGHSSYAITADIYSHVGPAQQREAADRLDQALRW
jgi:integrase